VLSRSFNRWPNQCIEKTGGAQRHVAGLVLSQTPHLRHCPFIVVRLNTGLGTNFRISFHLEHVFHATVWFVSGRRFTLRQANTESRFKGPILPFASEVPNWHDWVEQVDHLMATIDTKTCPNDWSGHCLIVELKRRDRRRLRVTLTLSKSVTTRQQLHLLALGMLRLLLSRHPHCCGLLKLRLLKVRSQPIVSFSSYRQVGDQPVWYQWLWSKIGLPRSLAGCFKVPRNRHCRLTAQKQALATSHVAGL
jgi:hypothetical protein